jgi:carboxypeptidase C (cathepsin A)
LNPPDDATAAVDNYNMVQAFLTRFPQYRTNDLYITSESYGGHYMPTLAKQIVDENAQAATTGNPVINFKGFAVGNPATTFYSAIPAGMDTYWGHQLISKPLYDKFVDTCKGPGHFKNVSRFRHCPLSHPNLLTNTAFSSLSLFLVNRVHGPVLRHVLPGR